MASISPLTSIDEAAEIRADNQTIGLARLLFQFICSKEARPTSMTVGTANSGRV
jgi:hypothetical protein